MKDHKNIFVYFKFSLKGMDYINIYCRFTYIVKHDIDIVQNLLSNIIHLILPNIKPKAFTKITTINTLYRIFSITVSIQI